MIDTGWPGTLPKYLHLVKQKGIEINQLKYLMVTHFHPDHAGLVQDFKELGVTFIIHDCQVAYVDELKEFFRRKPQYPFKDIDNKNNIVLSSPESRPFLGKIGIEGEIIETPGHSDDSVSLVADRCCAFTGDLPGLILVNDDSNPNVQESWLKIHSHQVKEVYPGHGFPFILEVQ